MQNNYTRLLVLLTGFFLPLFAVAQIKGRVVNENREGIPFASITGKNLTNGVNTDSNGVFSITHDEKFPIVLEVTSVGYRKNEFVIRNSSINDVTILLEALYVRDTVVITSRRRREVLQDVPIPISVVGAAQID